MTRWTEVPITWGDTDAGGLIYFPRFFHLFVVGLNAYFEPVSDHLMEELRAEGYVFPAIDASASFASPLRAGETARVGTTVASMGRTSLTVDFEVVRAEDGGDVATGAVTFVLVDEAFDPTPLPDRLRSHVEAQGDDEAGVEGE